MVQNDIDMHHYLPQEFLETIWGHMTRSTAHEDLAQFRGMFIVLSAKNIKLETKSSTFQECRTKVIEHLGRVFDWSKADLTNCWIDVGSEDTPTACSNTFLLKRQCLESWVGSMKHNKKSPRISSELFNWNLTAQAASGRAETRQSNQLRAGGIAYAQRYNLNKDLFFTSVKRGHGLFGEPDLEGITCPPSLLDAWIVAARQYRSAGLASSSAATPKLKRLRKVFDAMKSRINYALKSSIRTAFGVREEYRISWRLFMAANPAATQPHGGHQPFFTMSTAEVNGFMRWEFNRWIAAIEYIRSRCIRRDCSWEDHQRSMVMVTILLRSLQASVNCHHVAKRSQMFKESYNNRKCLPLQGLNFEGSMRDSGLAWLPRGLFNWFDLHMHDELVSSTTFVFNGLKGVFANWKAVETVDRAYKKARELEQHLRNAAPNEHEVVVDQMRKMVYQQFALHVIRQVCTDRNLENDTSNIEDGAIFQGHHGLSVDVIRRLIGEEPRYGQTRGGRRELGNTYPQRVRDIFGWDDGIARTSWDQCYHLN
ncbi:hypothetical protein H634G_11195 [Metarhizium anisopliae BRIP 53293]|uniref:Uncharacterized protein n=1 Tax=Metarhizium anisopliae BRIP 53293 TaxID=1291518 RepID=A0A0D9NHX5_METAN|nr:hypothetical protein H634G_11195 [Metarhizium anisopliae BRIP 53293]